MVTVTEETRSEPVHDVSCGRSLRERALGRAGSLEPVQAALVAAIAAEIEAHCGHRRLKCRRLAVGWTVAQAVQAAHDLVEEAGLEPVGLTDRSWKDWEAGGLPSPPYQDLLCRLFATNPVQLGFAKDYSVPHGQDDSPLRGGDARLITGTTEVIAQREFRTAFQSATAMPETGDEATNRRDMLKTLGFGAVSSLSGSRLVPNAAEAMGFTADLERTDVGPGVLEHLNTQIDELAANYAAAPALRTWPTVWALRHHTAMLLNGKATLAQRRELAQVGGMLSIILAWLAHDLGEPIAAHAYCIDARAHGQAAEAPELCAWADDTAATIALYSNRPAQALAAAQRGLSVAPQGTAARVRLASQVARAFARLGAESRFVAAHAVAHEASNALPAHASGLFSADAVRVISYDASSWLWLDQPERARRAAAEAVAEYGAAPYGVLSPTRMAIAHLDLAAACTALGEIEGAVDHGHQALNCGRIADAVVTRAEGLAHDLSDCGGGTASVRSFADDVRTTRHALMNTTR